MPGTSKEQEIVDLQELVLKQQHFILRAQDREIGLDHALMTARAGTNNEPLLVELAQIKGSVSYRLGRALTAPFRGIAFLCNFAMRALRWAARRIRSQILTRR